MSCGCFGIKGNGDAYEKAKDNAQKQAQTLHTTVAIWQEGSEWCYGPAKQAIIDGKPIREVFSSD